MTGASPGPSHGHARAKSRNTDICTEANNPNLTSMSQEKSKNADYSGEKQVPKSTMNLDKHTDASPTEMNITVDAPNLAPI